MERDRFHDHLLYFFELPDSRCRQKDCHSPNTDFLVLHTQKYNSPSYPTLKLQHHFPSPLLTLSPDLTDLLLFCLNNISQSILFPIPLSSPCFSLNIILQLHNCKLLNLQSLLPLICFPD